MIHLHTNFGPNTSRIFIFLHEAEIEHRVQWVDCTRGEHKTDAFRAISPNEKVPAIVDGRPDGGGPPLPIFESGAILLYLAEKTGQFMPAAVRSRTEVLKWLFWNQANLSPMFGQTFHFRHYAPEQERGGYAYERYRREVVRLLGVLDAHLDGKDYIAGAYSIADMACYPWLAIQNDAPAGQGADLRLGEYANVAAWLGRMRARPKVRSAYDYCSRNYPGHHGTPEEYRKYMYNDHCAPNLRPSAVTKDGTVRQQQ